jgi:hypothetical protein
MNEFWAAIAGAIVGGIITFVIQLVALTAAANDRERDSAEKKAALGHALLFKAMQIYSHLRLLNREMKQGLEETGKFGLEGICWQAVRPMANMPEKVHFSTDEMAMLLSLKSDAVFNATVSFDEVHNSTIDIFATYSERRSSLTALLPAEMNGTVGSTELDHRQLALLAPRMFELNALLATMLTRCDQDEREALQILTSLHATLSAKLGMTYKLQPKDDLESRDMKSQKNSL